MHISGSPCSAHAILSVGPLEPVSGLLTPHGEQQKVVPLVLPLASSSLKPLS